ncbi:MAG: hypothetical protein EA358_01200 [Flavobacteriales bacterium]|nr:MAG: hypothetical protein EA358_01200 [Flavobacteriales bacterium]
MLADFKRKDAKGFIRRILVTLRKQVPDARDLQKYLTQLEVLSDIRNYNSLVIKEIEDMPYTYDIKRDGRFKQGLEYGANRKQLQIARESLKNGGTPEFTARITGFPLKKIKEIQAQLESENPSSQND